MSSRATPKCAASNWWCSTTRIRPPKARRATSSASKQIRRIEAKGGVTVTQKEQKASGDSGIFDMQGNTVTLIGNVIVTRGTDVLRGQRLFVDLGSGRTTLDSGPGRVEGLFQPSRSSEKR